jgi:hypothetical protein
MTETVMESKMLALGPKLKRLIAREDLITRSFLFILEPKNNISTRAHYTIRIFRFSLRSIFIVQSSEYDTVCIW